MRYLQQALAELKDSARHGIELNLSWYRAKALSDYVKSLQEAASDQDSTATLPRRTVAEVAADLGGV